MIEMPFRLASADAPLLLIKARINQDGPRDFLIDTGNGAPLPLLVAPTLVQRLDLTAATAKGDSGGFSRVRIHRFELGDYCLENVEAGVLPVIEQINERLGAAIAGNLGYAFLKDWQVRIDYQNHRLHFTSGPAVNGDKSVPFETGPGGAFILLPVLVNGGGPYRFLLDTGASTSILSPKLAAELGISGQPVEALGVMGTPQAELATLDSLRVGDYTVPGLEVAIIDIFGYTSSAAGVEVDGIIGYSFLKQFVVEIDYPRRRIHFLPYF
ncbi:MAG: aspartyl protease family protein [bacterium]